MKLQVKFFRTRRGDEPVREYLEKLSVQDAAGLSVCVERLMSNGFLEMPHGRKMQGHKNLFEIRHRRHRILYGLKEGIIILLNAFMKKAQQTPKSEIETALERLKFF